MRLIHQWTTNAEIEAVILEIREGQYWIAHKTEPGYGLVTITLAASNCERVGLTYPDWQLATSFHQQIQQSYYLEKDNILSAFITAEELAHEYDRQRNAIQRRQVLDSTDAKC